jgi:CubicO group peptidase (beta-lactamase class C family)
VIDEQLTPATALPRSTPSAEGIDARGIDAFVTALERTPDVEPHSLMVLRHGRVVAEGWWGPYDRDRAHLLYSLSKSFTSTAVGFAVAEGLLSLDDTIISHFPEFEHEITDERSRRITVRHLLAMASGHREETVERAYAIDPVDLVRGFLLIPPDEEPGTLFCYNQPCTFTVGAIVQRASGQSLTEYLRPRLFDKLGIRSGIGEVGWQRDYSGRQLGFSGFHAPTEAIAKLGQLYLQKGVWNGEQLLSTDWVAEATRSHIDNSAWENPDWQQGYGFQFWMARHGYRGDGAYGQFCVILPEQDVVVAITSQSPDMQAVLDAAWAELLPAIDRPSTPSADEALASRLSAARLAPVPGGEVLTGSFTAAPGTEVPSLGEVRLSGEGDGDDWSLTLLEGEETLVLPIGRGAWTVTDAFAVSGGRDGAEVDGGVPRVEVIFVETPHRLQLTFDRDAGTFLARWQTPPLHGASLAQIRMPLS